MKPKKRIPIKTVIIVAVLIAALGSSALFAGAIWKEEEAVHINPDEIENSTLIVGTHLIHISTLTDAIYAVALDSATASGQSNMYYKSELADGTWFDISTANSLADITTAGTPVDKSVIAALFMTHHTKSDGKTYDLRTNAVVNIFDIKNPYDISTMDELLPLKNQFDQIVESVGKNDVSKRIEKILKVDVTDTFTKDCDSKLNALSAYNKVLADNNGGAKEQEAVQKVMEAVDAERRVYVLNIVNKLLNDYLDELGKPTGTEEKPAQQADSGLTTAVAESIKNVEDSLIKYEGLKLTVGTTVFQSVRFKYSNELITHAKDNNHSACDKDVANLISLDNIMNDTISNKDAELALVNSDLLGEAIKRYTEALKLGESAEYKAQLSNKAASAVLKNIISSNTATLNSYRNELEFIISAYCSRVGDNDALKFIDERIAQTKTYYAIPPFDAFFDDTSTTIDDHMAFLTKKRNAILSKKGGSEIDKLRAEKTALQTELKSALDKNDLAGAKEIENKISELDKKIGELEKAASGEVTQLQSKVSDLEKQLKDAQESGNTTLANKLSGELGAAKGELAAAQANLSDGSLGNQIELLKQDGLGIIKSDNPSADDIQKLETDINALIDLKSLDAKQVLAALTALYSEMSAQKLLDSTNAFDNAIAMIEEAIKNNTDSFTSAMESEKSDADLLGIAKDFIAGNIKGSDDLLDSGIEEGIGAGAGASNGDGNGDNGSGTGADSSGNGLGDGSGSGNGKDGGGSAGESSGVTLPSLSREELLAKYGNEVFLLALQSYYDETGSSAALSLMASTAQNMANLGNRTVFIHMKAADSEYIPLSTIQAYSGMRYVEKDSGTTATLAQGASYFGFKVYSNAVTIGKTAEDVEYMSKAAAYQSGIQICEDYAYKKFGIECVYLTNSQFGVVCTDDLRPLADELLGLFLS